MTPEERLTRIENIIHALTETQVRQESHIEKHSVQIEKHSAQIEKHSAQIEKQNVGIRDLIVISRTFLDSQKEVAAQIQGLPEALKALIENIDKLTRSRGPNGSS